MNFKHLWEIVVLLCMVILIALIVTKVEQDQDVGLSGRFRAADGDSLEQDGQRLRLLGIDAPELSQTCRRRAETWACGLEARQVLAGLVASGKTECRGSRRDRYDRLLVRCQSGSLDINREMVRRGLAVAFGDHEAEERAAKIARRGLWAGEFVQPSEWRASHRSNRPAEEPHFTPFLQRWFAVE